MSKYKNQLNNVSGFYDSFLEFKNRDIKGDMELVLSFIKSFSFRNILIFKRFDYGDWRYEN